MKARFWAQALAICAALGGATARSAETIPFTDPSVEWRKISTAHFDVVFDARHKELAEQSAQLAEAAYRRVRAVFERDPERAVIFLDDSSDLANGAAIAFPYPQITLRTAIPQPTEVVSEAHDWGYELVGHEIVHIFNIDPADGFWSPLRTVFGSIVRPNGLLPRWTLEGLAVALETRLSQGGRLRSKSFTAIPRAMALEGQNVDVGLINEVLVPQWPGGVRPYLYGGLVWNWLIERHGLSVVRDLNNDYGQRVPYLINGPVQEISGYDWGGVLERVHAETQAHAQEVVRTVCGAGQETCSSGNLGNSSGYFAASPVISPDGKSLAVVDHLWNLDSAVHLYQRENPAQSFRSSSPRLVFSGSSSTRASWLPDSRRMIVDSVYRDSISRENSDLWLVDSSAPARRLTFGARLREAVVSPDGQQIAAVRLYPGGTELVLIPWEMGRSISSDQMRVLRRAPLFHRLSWPEFLDSQTLVFTERNQQGAEVLKRISLREPENVLILTNASLSLPRKTSEGLIAISTQSGIANVYRIEKDARMTPLTNVPTRVQGAEVDSGTGELIASVLDAKGSRLRWFTRDERLRVPSSLATAPPLVEIDADSPENSRTAETVPAPPPLVATEYQPWSHLLPRYWQPMIVAGPRSAYIYATTGSHDVPGRHVWNGTAGYNTSIRELDLGANYVNRTTAVPMRLQGLRYWERFAGGLDRTTTELSFAAQLPESWIPYPWSFEIGANTNDQTYRPDGDFNSKRVGPMAAVSYADLTQYANEISPRRGGAFRLAHVHYLPGMSNTSYDRTDFVGTGYWSRFLPERHVIALSASVFWAPRLPSVFMSPTSSLSSAETYISGNPWLMRGYLTGTFFGRKMGRISFEYRFPISDAFRSFGTFPYFHRRFHGALVYDAITTDGYTFGPRGYIARDLGQVFSAVGGELRFDITAFYHLPAQLRLGIYYGFDRDISGGGGLLPLIGLSI